MPLHENPIHTPVRGGPGTGPLAVVESGAAGFSAVRLRPYRVWECPVHHGQAGFFHLVGRWRSASAVMPGDRCPGGRVVIVLVFPYPYIWLRFTARL